MVDLSLSLENCDGPNATLEGSSLRTIPQVLLFLQLGHIFSRVWCRGGQAKCCNSEPYPGAFNLSSKKLFTVNYLDHLSSFHRSSSVLGWS